MPGHGWQQAATDPVQSHLVESQVRPRLGKTEQALLRSQGGPLSGVPFSCFPTSVGTFRLCTVPGFLSLHLLATAGVAVSGTSLAKTVQFVLRLECWVVGVLRWSQPLPEFAGRQEPGWALIFWFVTWIWCFRVVRQSPTRGGCGRTAEQLVIDTTLVSPVGRDGLPRPCCAREDGAALTIARRRKERRVKFVVLACEVGGFAKAKAREPVPDQTRAPSVDDHHGVQQCESVLSLCWKREEVGGAMAQFHPLPKWWDTGSSAVWHEPRQVVRSRVFLILM